MRRKYRKATVGNWERIKEREGEYKWELLHGYTLHITAKLPHLHSMLDDYNGVRIKDLGLNRETISIYDLIIVVKVCAGTKESNWCT